MATLRCRPSEAEKEPAMVFMSSPQMLSLKLRNGDICTIQHKDQAILAVGWLTTKSDLKEGVIGLSKWLQDRASIKLGNEILVTKSTETVQDAESIELRAVDEVDDNSRLMWELVAAETVSEACRYLAPSQYVEITVGRQRKKFEVLAPSDAIYKAANVKKVRIRRLEESTEDKFTFDMIGGLRLQKAELQMIYKTITRSTRQHSLVSHATGILLHGPPGTGKSSLRKAFESEYEWSCSTHWDGAGSKLPPSTPLPFLIQVDMRNKLSPADAKALEKMFYALPSTTVIIGEINDPNDLQRWLRTANTFSREIDVSIPNASQRLEILKLLHDGLLSDDLLEKAAQKTHGYVGDDISKLLGDIKRMLNQEEEVHSVTNSLTEDGTSVSRVPTEDHLSLALMHVQPSALQEVVIEKPNVRWSDIGGQDAIKERLRNAVEWPLKYPKEMEMYGLAQKKGILLYGPPGCSKTMLVKALATESDYNFLAVKGAELLSMYVGESERATRELFRKARAASPCIIFLDEIDAIAVRAHGSSDVRVLTTILLEMDGFEELKGVLVVAATNKPQDIDPALMRPGRFDNIVYIGPPNEATREAIFNERFRRTANFSAECKANANRFAQDTEGMSGAEIVAVCQAAGELAFRDDSEGVPNRPIEPAHILEAINRQPRAITKAMLDEYAAWNAERGGL